MCGRVVAVGPTAEPRLLRCVGAIVDTVKFV